MGRPPWWAAALTGRALMRSPGRPPVRRDLERAFWLRIAEGLTSEDAALACGVSGPVGSRWFRHAGGMPPIDLAPVSGRYLNFSEREHIAVKRAAGVSMRSIADSAGTRASINVHWALVSNGNRDITQASGTPPKIFVRHALADRRLKI